MVFAHTYSSGCHAALYPPNRFAEACFRQHQSLNVDSQYITSSRIAEQSAPSWLEYRSLEFYDRLGDRSQPGNFRLAKH